MADPESSAPFLGGKMSDRKTRNERPKEPWKGEFANSIVYAGLDAIVTSFSLISSISAGRLSSVDVLVLGIANLVADGIGYRWDLEIYMSTSTERDLASNERSLTEWDVENHRRLQQQELLHRYQELGMDHIYVTIPSWSNNPLLVCQGCQHIRQIQRHARGRKDGDGERDAAAGPNRETMEERPRNIHGVSDIRVCSNLIIHNPHPIH
ncbi:uncharacterized protein [Primulina huaijiensis]|uniref:uncharacterized protein n=1 Tax=Primulina huaijiensis TaxID=1492673 RepID=UPI003CC6E20D